MIGLLLTWTWRFRREFWHRNNVLLLLSLLLLFAVFALKLTAGRPWLPYALPLAAVGMLVTVLLDAGVAMVMTALIAVLAAAVNGTGLELGAYVLFGGIAGHRRRPARRAADRVPPGRVRGVRRERAGRHRLRAARQPGRLRARSSSSARRPSPPAGRPSRPSAASR